MKLSEIAVVNFRLLWCARIRLDTTGITTILIGPDNSDKTPVIKAMLTFLQRPIERLLINDFSLGCRNTLKGLEQYVLAPPATVAPAKSGAAVAAPSLLPDLPVLPLHLKLGCDDAGPDLTIAGKLLMNLESAFVSVMVETRFTPVNPEQLTQTYLKNRDDDQPFFNYLATTLHNHCKLNRFKPSPDGSGAEHPPN